MERRELVFMDAKSSKFWNIELDGKSHTVSYGRTGTTGQSKTKDFSSEEAAKTDFEKMVAAKMKKGYVDGGSETAVGDSDGLPFVAFGLINKQTDMYENVKTFVGKKVADYDPESKPTKDGKTIYRFSSNWEEDNLVEYLAHFCESEAVSEAVGIVIGNWGGEDSQGSPDPVIELLVKHAANFPKLSAIYFGDITQEENEMSWIQQSDMSALLIAFPNLQLLRTRGGDNLSFTTLNHSNLRALAVETGGLPVEVVRSVCKSKLSNLEHLELWLGTEEYGGSSSVQDLQPILSGKLFPKLRYLGLRNCDYADDIAGVIVNSPIIQRIETLDLSFGTLTDEGGQALCSLPEGGTLKKVSLNHNFITDPVKKKLEAKDLVIDVSQGEADTSDDEWRFVAVGE